MNFARTELRLEVCIWSSAQLKRSIHWTVFRSTDEETTRMEQKVIVESLLPAHGFEIWGFKFSRMNIISPWRGQMGKPETQGSLHLRYQVNRRMNRHSAREIICVFRSLSLNFRKVRLSCNIVGSQSRGIIGSIRNQMRRQPGTGSDAKLGFPIAVTVNQRDSYLLLTLLSSRAEQSRK